MECICNNKDFQAVSICKVCKNSFSYFPSDFFRPFHCPAYKKIPLCYLPEAQCCQSCKDKGYSVEIGYSGPDIIKLNNVDII